MNWKDHMAQARKFEERFLKKMPRTDDLTTLVLKGHLLMEELINATIDGLLAEPEMLEAAQLTCFQRTRLLMAMLPNDGIREGILEAFEKLNAIRNKYSHMLEPPQIDAHIESFIKMVELRMETTIKTQALLRPERLSRAICFLCGQLEVLGLFHVGVSKLMWHNTGYENGAHVGASGAADAGAK